MSHPLRLPAKISNMLYRISRTVAKKTAELKRKPTLQEIARETGITEHELNQMLEVSGEAASLHEPIDEQGDLVLGDLLEQTTIPSVEHSLLSQSLVHQVRAALEGLERNEEKVLRLRFGMDDDKPRTLKQIGDLMGLSRERIRQIEAKALEKLRTTRRQTSLAGYLSLAS